MSAKVYVGNLSWNTTDDTLRDAFSSFGQVTDSIVMRDRETNRSRGFGFVTYSSGEEANHAIASMNEQELDGRRIKVNMANARGGGGGGGGAQGGYPQGGYQQQGYQQQPSYGNYGAPGGGYGYPQGQQGGGGGYGSGGYGGYQQGQQGGYGGGGSGY